MNSDPEGPVRAGQLSSVISKSFHAGLVLYPISFLLPAVTLAQQPMRGWACAWMSLFMWTDTKNGSWLILFGGLINPLAIAYVMLRLIDRVPRARFVLASAILFCIPFTWLCLLTLKMGVLIGHVV